MSAPLRPRCDPADRAIRLMGTAAAAGFVLAIAVWAMAAGTQWIFSLDGAR